MSTISNFNRDLKRSQKAEILTYEVFSQLTNDYNFEWVGENPEWYYKGDIKAIDSAWGMDEIGVEVKDDSRIADTGRVLCEYAVYNHKQHYRQSGNMCSNYNYYCVVSQQNKLIYVLDFEVLKKVYRRGKHGTVNHNDDYGNLAQTTYCYFCTINQLCKWGALMYFIWYDEKEGHYYPVKVEKEENYII